MPIKDTKGYPIFCSNNKSKRINGKIYYWYLVIGNHGVSSTWLPSETIKQIKKDGLIGQI